MKARGELLREVARAFPNGLQLIPASTLDRHNLRAEWALGVVADAPIPWELLSPRYPPTHGVRLYARGAERATTLADARGEPAELVVLDALGREADLGDYASVPRVAERLRAPGGCPWDRAQSHASLRPYLLEEAYEAVDALDDDDLDRFADELGDLLFQVVIHAQLGAEEGVFDLNEVTRRLAAKLIRRHPHVFGGETYAGADHLVRWEQLKREESEAPASIIGGVPRSLPALFMAERLLERAERVRVQPPLDGSGAIGGRLFAMVAEARAQGVDAEQALRAVNRRFAERFERFEALARLNGRELETLTDHEVDDLWEQAK